MKIIKLIVALAVITLVGMQFFRVDRSNPPVSNDLSAPPEVKAILKRACYDCHSNETRWPWYSGVAPISWLVVRDVTLGRKEMNFSEWDNYYAATRRHKLQWMGRALRRENMPPWPYRLIHPATRLTNADRAALERWIESELASPSASKSTE
jgi:Haem-binding domain